MQNRRTDVLITLDIKQILAGDDLQQATIPPRSKCDSADFEEWVPADSGSTVPQCILGKTYSFTRMRQTTGNDPCILAKDYSPPPLTTQVRVCKSQPVWHIAVLGHAMEFLRAARS